MPRLPALALIVLALPAGAWAQDAPTSAAPPADGLYEDFSSFAMQPSVPRVASPATLSRWVDVHTSGRVTTVTFEPDGRVVWRITWGPHGPERKVTLVDGVVWTRSRFHYDAAGHLATKVVHGPGAGSGITYTYTTDPSSGQILGRSATLAGPNGTSVLETMDVTRTSRGTLVTIRRDGHPARSDRWDAHGRLMESRFFDGSGTEAGRLRYERDAQGLLVRIRRRVGAHRGIADPTHPDTTLSSSDVAALAAAPLEHHEALLLLGAPTTSSEEGRGVARVLHTDFAPDACWMNETSGLQFDAAGLLVRGTVGCICGFCVDASLVDRREAAQALGIGMHWTRGPWVRIDGAIDVTIEHELVTPDGPRAAGSLAPGDVVTAADGSPHTIVSVELLPDEGLRLGENLTGADGTFAAGGLRFVSETTTRCP